MDVALQWAVISAGPPAVSRRVISHSAVVILALPYSMCCPLCYTLTATVWCCTVLALTMLSAAVHSLPRCCHWLFFYCRLWQCRSTGVGCALTGCALTATSCVLTGCALTATSCVLTATGCVLTGCVLTGCVLTGCVLTATGCVLTGCVLTATSCALTADAPGRLCGSVYLATPHT